MTADDPRIVALYDEDNPDGPDHDFFRSLADDATAIVDLGCGTGLLTVSLARPGRRVVGVDPSSAMLAVARHRAGTEAVSWIDGDSRDIPEGPFDLALMTGNVAQHIPDADWPRTLRDLRTCLRPGGTLAFESRNPADRAWEAWAAAAPSGRDSRHGRLVEWMDVDPGDGRTVRFRAHARFGSGETVVEAQDLVFRSRSEIERDLDAAGFAVEAVHRDWDGEPFAGTGRLMIVVARAR